MNYYFNAKAETMDQEELKKVQLMGLINTVRNAYINNAFYRTKFDDLGLNPDDIKSLDDLSRLGFIDKNDFRDQSPLGMLCTPESEIREMHMSSGSTGDPVVMVYDEHDLDQWA